MTVPDRSTSEVEISAIVVAYNSSEHIVEMIRTLEASLSPWSSEIIVVDNASKDDSFAIADGAIRRGQALKLDENVGYGRGANRGLEVATGRMALILNDDVGIESESIRLLIDAIDSGEDVRLAVPRMVTPGGERLPTGRRFLPGIRDEMARISDRATGQRKRAALPHSGPPIEVEFVLAACLMAERGFLVSLGGFSDAFFMYGEDIDLCRRVASVGGRRVVVPDAEGRHDQSVADDRRIRGREFSGRILNARDTYYRIWLSRPERMAINLVRAFGISDQPHRFLYHFPKVVYDGPSLADLRKPGSLPTTPVSGTQ